ncbi:MAG: hypothetical protein HQ523_02195 [Lentisphaerae bacterium]|nr:hypothetical protein [Lentisphaerota bacterium]
MLPREIVRRSIHFDGPTRLPFTGSMGETDFSGDTVAIFPDGGCKWWLGGGGQDEWGCEWEVSPETNDMGQVKNIVLPDLADHEQVVLPDALNRQRYAAWETVLDRAEEEGKYVVLCNGPLLFERAHFLHGFADTLVAAMETPELLGAFLRHIARYHLETVRAVHERFPGRIHGYRGTDDWGTQTAPLISPTTFDEVFQPVYAEIFGAIHDAGMDAWMHSCGHNLALIPSLIDAGLNVINLLQPTIFPISRLKELSGRICFEMVGDMQTTLPRGDRAEISREIEEILAACCTETGGLVVEKMDRMFFDGDGIAPELAPFCEAEYQRRDPWVDRT